MNISAFLKEKIYSKLELEDVLYEIMTITNSHGGYIFTKDNVTNKYTQKDNKVSINGNINNTLILTKEIVSKLIVTTHDIQNGIMIPIMEDERNDIGVIMLWNNDVEYTLDLPKNIADYLCIVKILLQKERLMIDFQRLDLYSRSGLAKTLFLANISHEIRTPLNGIVGYSQLLMQTQLNVTQQGFITSLNKCSTQLLQIMNDILDFSKLSNGKMTITDEYFDIKDVIETVKDVTSSKLYEKRQMFNVNIGTDVPKYIISDKNKIIQILVNLISNANKFTKTGGVINVDINLIDEPYILKFDVNDNGMGITESDQCKLFNSFIQLENSKYKTGTGLGLFICKKLCELLGGDINVTSNIGKGSTFTFTIRYKEYQSLKLNNEILDDLSIFKDKYILVVDDNVDNRILLIELLTSLGMLPIACETALEAVRVVMTNCYPFALGLIDIHMPGVSGDELARLLKEEYPFFNMIALSSYDTLVNSNLFEHKIDKPIDKIILYNAIYSLLKRDVEEGVVHFSSDSKISKKNIRFLIAEDISYNANMLVSMLQTLGYTDTKIFSNGEEIIDFIEQNRYNISRNNIKNVLILDLIMPIKDGFDVINYIKKYKVNIPIVVVTASVMDDARTKCKELGINHFINKPIRIKELREVITVLTLK